MDTCDFKMFMSGKRDDVKSVISTVMTEEKFKDCFNYYSFSYDTLDFSKSNYGGFDDGFDMYNITLKEDDKVEVCIFGRGTTEKYFVKENTLFKLFDKHHVYSEIEVYENWG